MFSDVLTHAAARSGARRGRGGHRRPRRGGRRVRTRRARAARHAHRPASPRPRSIGIRHAVAEGFERALLVPGDTPLLDSPASWPADRRRRRAVAIVPDRHGTGTNALVLTPPDAIEPSFGPGSFARHVAAAEAAGVPHRVEQVPAARARRGHPRRPRRARRRARPAPGRAPSTRGALRQLDRVGAWPVAAPDPGLTSLIAHRAPAAAAGPAGRRPGRADRGGRAARPGRRRRARRSRTRWCRRPRAGCGGSRRSSRASVRARSPREHRKDPRLVQAVLDESAELLRAVDGTLICVTHHGFVCANAGVDQSNVSPRAASSCCFPRTRTRPRPGCAPGSRRRAE